jgi:Beta-lactamase enzyme family
MSHDLGVRFHRVWAIAGAAALIVSVLGALPGQARADTAQTACAAMDPFTPALAAELAARWPGQRFSASIYDERTGCQFDLHPDLRLTTASVLKVEVMAGILLRAQSQGRPLSAQERSLILPMITQSQDAATDVLWSSLGGAGGMTALNSVFGMTQTTQVGPIWGLTVTSARDQVHLLRQVLLGDFGPLGASYRAEAFNYMTSVIPSQRWGITAGVPAGWPVANKNGFASSACCSWRINSTGVVYDPSGGAYAIALLSDHWPNEASGIAAIETVNRAVAAQLARPMTAPWYYLRNTNTSGSSDQAFTYGNAHDVPLIGDWNGDGKDTAGVDRQGNFLLRNNTGGGFADTSFFYGDPGDEVFVGDWTGSGKDTIGIRRGTTFYLRNTNTSGGADTVFNYGDPGDEVIIGDWNGDGTDTIGLYRPSTATFYLRNTNSTGIADIVAQMGNTGDIPIAGRWTPGAPTTIGVYRPSTATFYLRNTNTSGGADTVVNYGNPGDTPIVGDWTATGIDTVGIIRTRF